MSPLTPTQFWFHQSIAGWGGVHSSWVVWVHPSRVSSTKLSWDIYTTMEPSSLSDCLLFLSSALIDLHGLCLSSSVILMLLIRPVWLWSLFVRPSCTDDGASSNSVQLRLKVLLSRARLTSVKSSCFEKQTYSGSQGFPALFQIFMNDENRSSLKCW